MSINVSNNSVPSDLKITDMNLKDFCGNDYFIKHILPHQKVKYYLLDGLFNHSKKLQNLLNGFLLAKIEEEEDRIE